MSTLRLCAAPKARAAAAACEAPLPTALVYPCDDISLRVAVEAASTGLMAPVLVGPAATMQRLAAMQALDLSGCCLVDATSAHAAVEVAAQLARDGEVGALMQGALPADEMVALAMRKDHGLRVAPRLSQVAVVQVPGRARPLLITDAAINVSPSLEDKAQIVQNAIRLAQALGLARPKVAILSSTEAVNPKIASTLEAAVLCKMAERGQITGGLLDGPLALDDAICADTARAKGLASPVAGDADILLVPDLVAGDLLVKQLRLFAAADAASVVLGARLPVILAGATDTLRSRLASCALAARLAAAQLSH
ncbi:MULTISPECIES: bifunctional enoyl-CoA hydratase/phosphate acetyltransferase [Rubrivivax]|uniref:Bifunctional enoyl-CoA hydratase/phosphate acetyltransferase n=1 Tax=Rubrivivax benzoatilyticus TaxID=316997 RepID=A0ABX0HNU9_9BURK|nr:MULTISPECIES: bifunctional enoyl-CoA hydratase/phosphate acetyltransferase [Rubrivivax]NHK96752.1 bifunctional enoyl-CoA hydratase/phosphate acetyltransferase [Rubrivivax benzoatilyticus]NHL24467.1 bifunctional enoyl-CoA hydratase/phosphate acetyltransferase [Rubrivivax benzoatilyticus]